MAFYLFDLNFDPMTLILKLDRDIKIYLYTEHEVPRLLPTPSYHGHYITFYLFDLNFDPNWQ